ncbi:MAG: glycosyltransferase [Alcanivoracaceae bacterium]
MRVLAITNLFPLPWDSNLGLFNAQQLTRLATHHEVSVVVPVPWRQWWRHRHQCVRHVYADITVIPVIYWYFPGLFRASYAITLFLSLWLQRCRFRDPAPDVLLATWLYPDAVAASWLARCWRRPLLMKAHGSDVNVQCQSPLRRRQVIAASRRAASVLTVSRDLAVQLAAMGVSEQKLHTLYNGIDTTRFFPGDKATARDQLRLGKGERLLLYIGNLKASKGVIDLIEALRGLPPSQWHQCVIIGEGADRPLLEKHIMTAGLERKVTLTGRRPHDEIRQWMTAADLLLLPSHAEGVPNVVLEAMACGLPVVASQLPGIEEVVPSHAGILAPPKQPEKFADAITRALATCWQREQIAAHAREFGWQRNIDRLDELLQQAQCAGVSHD